jgi:hypothetical protein
MRLRVDVQDGTVRGNIRRYVRDLRRMGELTPKRAAEAATVFAKSLAPKHTGQTQAAITNIKEGPQKYLIISFPPVSDGGFNVPFVFNLATSPNDFFTKFNMTMWGFAGPYGPRVPFVPKSSATLQYMTKTARFMEQEFPARVNKQVAVALAN